MFWPPHHKKALSNMDSNGTCLHKILFPNISWCLLDNHGLEQSVMGNVSKTLQLSAPAHSLQSLLHQVKGWIRRQKALFQWQPDSGNQTERRVFTEGRWWARAEYPAKWEHNSASPHGDSQLSKSLKFYFLWKCNSKQYFNNIYAKINQSTLSWHSVSEEYVLGRK